MRVPKSAKLKPISNSRVSDGSYFAWLDGKVEDPDASAASGRKCWKTVKLKVRVIRYQTAGFRASRIATTQLDPAIKACELVRHYHRRYSRAGGCLRCSFTGIGDRSPLKKSFGLRPVLSTHLCVASPTTILHIDFGSAP